MPGAKSVDGGAAAVGRTLGAFGMPEKDASEAAHLAASDKYVSDDLMKFLMLRYNFAPGAVAPYAQNMVESPNGEERGTELIPTTFDAGKKPEYPYQAYLSKFGGNDRVAEGDALGTSAEALLKTTPTWGDVRPPQQQVEAPRITSSEPAPDQQYAADPYGLRLQRAEALRKHILGH